MRRRKSPAAVAFSFLFLFPVSWSAAQEFASWDSLPEETVAAFRVPDGQAFVEALRETKFGAVMLSEQRKAAVEKVLESSGNGEWEDFHKQLNEYGLTMEDLLGLLAGESGYAAVMQEEGEEVARMTFLGWLEPGEELANKLYEVVAKVIDEQDDEQPVIRVDLTIADIPVMQLQFPSTSTDYDDEYKLEDDYSELSDEEQEEALEKAKEIWRNSGVESIKYQTLLIGVLGDRLLIAHRYKPQKEEAAAESAEQLAAVLGQWIKAHATGSEGFSTRLTDESGAARVMGMDGLPVFELLGDVVPLVKILRASAPTEEKAEQAVRILGLDGLGPFAMRSTIEGAEWYTQMSLAMPSPRQGLMQLFDQEALPADPPQWVPASAVRYYQWSFDLGKAYEVIKETALREFPDKATQGFAMAEMQVQNFAQASLQEVLSSLGNRHIVMSFGMDSDETSEDGDDDDKELKSASERVAIVWQLEDEELWGRLLKAITPFAGMVTGTKFVEEQGFSGWRMKKETTEGGLFLGKGYLVLAFGNGVMESVLSTLNNPPTGNDALRGSEVFAKANAMIDLKPSQALQVTDGDRYMKMLVRAMNKQLKQADNLAELLDNDDRRSGLKTMLSLGHAVLPSEEEINGMLGVIVSRWEVNDEGVFGSTVQEMPEK